MKNISYSGHRDCDPELRLWANVAARQLPDQLHEAGEEGNFVESTILVFKSLDIVLTSFKKWKDLTILTINVRI